MVAVTICSDLEPPKIKSDTVSIVSPSICHEVMGLDALILVIWMLSFKPAFSLSYFTFIKMPFSSSSLSAIRVVLSAYLRLLIFLLAILIPTCASSSPAFHMMSSAYKLNKQGDNIQPWHTPFPVFHEQYEKANRTLKDELPGPVGAQHASEISGEITPERMKRQSQSKNNNQWWIWLMMEVKSNML